MIKRLTIAVLVLLCTSAFAEVLDSTVALSCFLAECRGDDLSSFQFETTDALYTRLMENNYADLNALFRSNGVLGYNWRSNNNVISVSDVSYLSGTLFSCGSEEEVLNAFRSGVSDFCLLLTDKLFMDLMANDRAILTELQGKAGLISDNILWYSDSAIICYTGTSLMQGDTINDLQSARLYIEKCTENLADTIEIRCSESLYSKLLPVLDLITSNAGIYTFTYNARDELQLLTLDIEEYYPGVKIANGGTEGLTDREYDVYMEALAMAEECAAETPLQTAKNIHDALCERITYQCRSGKTDNDTAIGALLNGKADCDGYADAFLAVAALAGLNVRMQSGLAESTSNPEHMWNLMEIDGTWRAVDVTWDDQETAILDERFNIGEDLLSLTHTWNHDVSVAIVWSVDKELSLITDDSALESYLKYCTDPITFETDKAYGESIVYDRFWSRLRFVGLLCGMDNIAASYRETLTGYAFTIDAYETIQLPTIIVTDADALIGELARQKDMNASEFALLLEDDAMIAWDRSKDEWLSSYQYTSSVYTGFTFMILKNVSYFEN